MRNRSLYFIAIAASLTIFTNTANATVIGLPNYAKTPGAIDPRVTQANIASTICVVGYTKTVRPPVSYTNSLKYQQLHSGYAVGGDMNMHDYEEDHLIPLAVGGNPTSPLNLFPQFYGGPYGARHKDQLELKMHLLVCAGSISLANAQAAFKKDWRIAYRKYVGPLS